MKIIVRIWLILLGTGASASAFAQTVVAGTAQTVVARTDQTAVARTDRTAVTGAAREAAISLQLSRRLQDQQKYAEAKINAQKAVDAYLRLNEPDSLGEAYVMLWSTSALAGMSFPDRMPILQKAAAAFEKAGNRRREADCYKEIADLQQITANIPAAILSLQQSLRLFQSVNYPNLQGVYDLLCVTSGYLDEFDEAVRYGLLAIRYCDDTKDTSLSLVTYYNHLGMAYYALKDFDKAELYYRRSLDIASKYKDPDGIATLSFNTERLYNYWRKPRKALAFLDSMRAAHPTIFAPHYQFEVNESLLSCYDGLGQPGKAAPYADSVESAMNRGDPSHSSRSLGYIALLNHYFHLHDYDRANTWLVRYIDLVRTSKIPRYMQNALYWHYRIDSAQGKYVEAMRYLMQWKLRGDTILDQKKRRLIEQYNALYESEKKDKSIVVLQQQTQTQEASLRHEEFLRKVTLGGIALLVIIVGLLFNTVRMKQRSNRLLEVQRSEIDRKNQSLQQLVTEKEWLVKEIHHRVKNNLHMVVGLLASQAEYLKGREAQEAITDSQHRIQAMSLIHQKLYNTENLSSIDMPHYVRELVDYLESFFDTRGSIRFHLDIARVSFPLSHSIPLGLILNEAITNSIKYAFPGGGQGQLSISLQEAGGPETTRPVEWAETTRPAICYRLTIADDGIGIPADYRKNSSLGISLIEGLSNDIRGKLTIRGEKGTVITLIFPVEQLAPITQSQTHAAKT